MQYTAVITYNRKRWNIFYAIENIKILQIVDKKGIRVPNQEHTSLFLNYASVAVIIKTEVQVFRLTLYL